MKETYEYKMRKCFPDRKSHAIHQVSKRKVTGEKAKCSRCNETVWHGRDLIMPGGVSRWFSGYLIHEWP